MSESDTEPARRGFLAGALALIVGAGAVAAPLLSGLAVLLDPLRRRRDDTPLIQVTNLGVLPADGVPRKFTVRTDRTDAWNTYRDSPVGAVYIRRTPESVVAHNVVCPHAGCFVGLAPDGNGFRCPCHKSSFDLDGSVNDPASPAPRGMDSLDVEVRNGDEVWVRFQNFRPGQAEKTPV
ncbi:MAG: Rieske 2Fe-2S domain-containing protein [Gemmatimonadetes bacterium]|nr:Rieske 2Fe-2S domain-containing protein [Gemmatimonadota bacterium]